MKRKKRTTQRRGVRDIGRAPAPPANGKRHQSRGILRDLLKGLLFIALVLAIKLVVERTTFGKQLELMSYNLLQLQLSSERVPVTIVDISDLEPQVFNIDGRTGKATPRESLREMIQAIADQEPKAIGVDIDFSPDENGYIHPRDPEFFQFCLDTQKQTRVPMFLGIKRTISKAPAEWLGSEKYQDLAANILIPKDSKRMVNVIRVGDELKPGGAGKESIPSKAMSVVLADAYGRESNDSLRWHQRLHEFGIEELKRFEFIERMSEKRLGPGLSVEDFLVDFSPLESIEPLRTINPVVLGDQSQRRRFEGKIVLLGDGTLNKAADTFVVPARQQPYPGVFLHACAAYTLIREPLYEVTQKGRLGFDILFSVSILLAVIFIRLYYRNKASEKVAMYRLQGFFTLLVVLAAIIVGVVFVRTTRVMWDDFFLALIALMYHPSIGRYLESSWKEIRKHASAAFHRLVFEHKETHR